MPFLRTAATSRREQSSTSRESQKTKKDRMRHYVQNQTSLRNEWISMYKCKSKFRMKSYECSENCARQQTRRKDKDDPKRVASKAQLPLSSDALNGRATGLMPVPGVDLRISNYDIRACHPSDPCTAVVEGEWRRLYRMPSTVSCLIQSSTAANQCSSRSRCPSLLTVLAPVRAVSLRTSPRSSTKQCACKAATVEALPSLPQGWRTKCRSRNGIPFLLRKSIRCVAPARVPSIFDSPA